MPMHVVEMSDWFPTSEVREQLRESDNQLVQMRRWVKSTRVSHLKDEPFTSVLVEWREESLGTIIYDGESDEREPKA